MKSKHTNALTAAGLMGQLLNDTEFVGRSQAREANREKIESQLRIEEGPLLAELAGVGFRVNSVWDLVNSSSPYLQAVPVLGKHLGKPYHPKIREGIIRALTVPNLPSAISHEILNELKRLDDRVPRSIRWALANALTIVADLTIREEMAALLDSGHFEDVRPVLELAIENLRRRDQKVRRRLKE